MEARRKNELQCGRRALEKDGNRLGARAELLVWGATELVSETSVRGGGWDDDGSERHHDRGDG